MLQINRQGSRAQDADGEDVDLLALAGALWRGKAVVIACVAVAVVLGIVYAFVLAVPKYLAATTLELEVQQAAIVDIESVVAGTSTEDSAMNTEVRVIQSRSILERLVDRLDLTEDPEFNRNLRPESALSAKPYIAAVRQAMGLGSGGAPLIPAEQQALNDTVDSLREAVSASVERNTYIFQISALTADPIKSQVIVNSLADVYVEDQIAQKQAATESAVTWLSERVASLEVDLRAKEDEFKDFRTQTDLVSVEAIEAINRQLSDARERLATAQADEAVLRSRLAQAGDLFEASEFADLALLFDDRAIESAASSGSTEAARTRSSARIATLEASIGRQSQQTSVLQGSVDRLQDQVASQSEDLALFQQLERELLSIQTLYETFLARLKEATVQRGLQQPDSRILSAAIPGRYVEPRKPIIIVMSAFLGFLAGAALVFARQFLNSGYRAADELEADIERPIFGQIPLMPIRKRNQLLTYLTDKPSSAASEAIRNLRTSILLSNPQNPPQVIVSTSSLPGEGKTTQSIAMAHNLAGLGKRVLLVEGDVRRRTLDEYFKTDAVREGLASALDSPGFDIGPMIVRDPRLDADVILGERSGMNAADLFSSKKFADFLKKMREDYDFIVIDTPPVLVVPDARVIGQLADCIIFSIAWNRTGRQQVREAIRQLATVNLKPTGMVLSKIDVGAMKKYGYGGKYGAYGDYGASYYET